MDLNIINAPATLWDNKSNTAYQALYDHGGQIYKADSDPTDESLWRYVIANADRTYKDPIITGYSTSDDDKYPPNCGIWNTQNTFMESDNAGLIALWTYYAALNVLLGHNVTYAQLADIDLTGIPESDFTLTIKDGVITDMASQPYDSEGNLKSHLQ